MNPIPQTMSINDLCNDYKTVLALATKAPVFLTDEGRADGVLVSITAWNELLAQVEGLQDVVDVLEAELALARGEDEYGEMTAEHFVELQAKEKGMSRKIR